MLKWTNSAQKPFAHDYESGLVERNQSPHIKKRLRRRTTICQLNKENVVPITSTPCARNLQPLRNLDPVKTSSPTTNFSTPTRARNSTYASTLPRFEEEYSPNTIVPSGQELALRGLLPDVFMGNRRYFSSPLMQAMQVSSHSTTPKRSRRKLELELEECEQTKFVKPSETTSKESAKMTDQSLDKLIDAILESACKTQKKKKTRKSLNLRRRTLLKTQEENIRELSLSPSYAAGDDPASDLSFLLVEPTKVKKIKAPSIVLPPTPLPHTPIFKDAVTNESLLRMLTPAPSTPLFPSNSASNVSTTTFNLETPIRPVRKRRLCKEQEDQKSDEHLAKKYKTKNCNYLEVGLALPSIYV